MQFNENTRVKLPAILHLCRLGYSYLSLRTEQWDEETNIFTQIFVRSFQHLNRGLSAADAHRALKEISLCLENEDLGKTFYEKLTAT